jgi:hypothetical protein
MLVSISSDLFKWNPRSRIIWRKSLEQNFTKANDTYSPTRPCAFILTLIGCTLEINLLISILTSIVLLYFFLSLKLINDK